MLSTLLAAVLAQQPQEQPYPHETRLPCGVPVWSFGGGGSRFAIGAVVGVGSRDEDPERTGIAHLLEHVLFRGTRELRYDEIRTERREARAELNGHTTKEVTAYWFSVPREHAGLAVRWLADLLARPAFADDDVADEQKIVFEEIDQRDDHVGDPWGEGSLYEGHPLGRSIGGDQEGIRALGVAELRAFWRRHYRRDNLVIAVPQPDDLDAASLEVLERALAELPERGEPSPRTPPRPLVGIRPLGAFAHEGQAQGPGLMVAGFHLRERTTHAFAGAVVLQHLLQDRFFTLVREGKKLAYSPHVECSFYEDAWRIDFSARVSDRRRLTDVLESLHAVVALPDLAEREVEAARQTALEELTPRSAKLLVERATEAWMLRRIDGPRSDVRRALRDLKAADVAAAARTELVEANRYVLTSAPVGAAAAWAPAVALVLAALFIVDGLREWRWLRRAGELLSRMRRRRRPA